MTYIEFFDMNAIENVCSCLIDAPERVVFIGDNEAIMKKHTVNYARVFSKRGHTTEFVYRVAPKHDLRSAVKLLNEIIDRYGECSFDMTGGEEIYMFALGWIVAKHPKKPIRIHRCNVKNGKVYDFDENGNMLYKQSPHITVEENIRIYGGDISYGTIHSDKTYCWDLSKEFIKDAQTIWDICKKDTKLWNLQITVFSEALHHGTFSEDGLSVTVNVPKLTSMLARNKGKFVLDRRLIQNLIDARLISAFRCSEREMVLTFKNEQIKKCLTKAGQALEMMTYITAVSQCYDDGRPMYHDAQTGVVIDWEPIAQQEHEEHADTNNEIDVLLMHSIVPVFISCKNGRVETEELYKLNTVANRFGGKFSKKVLVASGIPNNSKGDALRQRAQDMGIHLIEGVSSMSNKQFSNTLRYLWR